MMDAIIIQFVLFCVPDGMCHSVLLSFFGSQNTKISNKINNCSLIDFFSVGSELKQESRTNCVDPSLYYNGSVLAIVSVQGESLGCIVRRQLGINIPSQTNRCIPCLVQIMDYHNIRYWWKMFQFFTGWYRKNNLSL